MRKLLLDGRRFPKMHLDLQRLLQVHWNPGILCLQFTLKIAMCIYGLSNHSALKLIMLCCL